MKLLWLPSDHTCTILTKKDVIETMVKELLDSGVVRLSHNPFSSLIELVKKKDGTWKMCIDYKKLNKNKIKDKFLIPFIEELIDELHGAKVFSKLDLRSGNHQIRMGEEDIYQTTFKSHEGHCKFSSEAQAAFEMLHQAMTEALVLALPNFKEEFIIEIDALGYGVGVVLQQSGHPIAFLSKTLAPKTTDLVLNDIVKSLQHGFVLTSKYTCQDEQLKRKGKWVVRPDEQLRKRMVLHFHTLAVGAIVEYKLLLRESAISSERYDLFAYPGLLQPFPIPNQIWQDMSMDFVDSLPMSQAKTIAQLFLDNIYKLHRLPKTIVSDRDRTEVVSKCLDRYLRCMNGEIPKDWVQWLPLAEYWYNTTFHNATNTTPFEMGFLRVLFDSLMEDANNANAGMYVSGSASFGGEDLLRSVTKRTAARMNKMIGKGDSKVSPKVLTGLDSENAQPRMSVRGSLNPNSGNPKSGHVDANSGGNDQDMGGIASYLDVRRNAFSVSVNMHMSSPVDEILIHGIDDVAALFSVPLNSLKEIDDFTKYIVPIVDDSLSCKASPSDPIVQAVDINTKSTSYAGAAGASAKDQPKVNFNFRLLVVDPVFEGVNISIPRKVMEKGGPWLIRNSLIILKKWSMDTRLLKEELTHILIWVKLHDVPIQVFEEDGISLISTFIGKPVMLDSYTISMCNDSWGRSSFARCLVEVNSEADLVDVVTISIPSLMRDGFTKETIRVEYE
ncbi:zinc knuckle CX2CX4HX4C containing protein [Tanacetum coccineum]